MNPGRLWRRRRRVNIECGYRFAHFFNKIETPKAYLNSTLEIRCSMFDVPLEICRSGKNLCATVPFAPLWLNSYFNLIITED